MYLALDETVQENVQQLLILLQNRRMAEVGRDFCRSACPAPLLEQSHLDQTGILVAMAGNVKKGQLFTGKRLGK